jgi:hypothetical protein
MLPFALAIGVYISCDLAGEIGAWHSVFSTKPRTISALISGSRPGRLLFRSSVSDTPFLVCVEISGPNRKRARESRFHPGETVSSKKVVYPYDVPQRPAALPHAKVKDSTQTRWGWVARLARTGDWRGIGFIKSRFYRQNAGLSA